MAQVTIVAPEDLPIPPTRGGSVQIYLWNLHRTLLKDPAVEATLISPGRPATDGQRTRIAIQRKTGPYRQQVLKRLRAIRSRMIQVENRPDFVPTIKQGMPAAQMILNLHSTTFLGPRHISAARARHVLRSCDAVVLNSHHLRNKVAKQFNLTDGNWHAVVIHPGVNFKRYARSGRVGRQETNRPLQLLFVGRVIRQKGVHILLDAVRQLIRFGVPVQLTIVGRTPPWEADYARRVRRAVRGLPVRWVGFVEPDRLPQYYWNADVLICPSQQSEAFGLVNVEAMAAGVPVVASRQGGIKEIVQDGCGILIADYKSGAAFAKAIQSLHEDRQLLARLQTGAEERARAFTWERTARKFRELYREVSNRQSG